MRSEQPTRTTWRRKAVRGVVAQLIGGSLFAYCGAKGSPQPPLPEQARHADAGVASAAGDAGTVMAPAGPAPADAGAP